MSNRRQQLLEDRRLRDAALALVKADITRLQDDFSGRSLGVRALDRAKDGANELLEQAGAVADSNRGILATLIMAIGLWFARNPILALFFDEEDWADPETEGGASPDTPAHHKFGDEE